MNWRPLPQSGDPLTIIRRLVAQINEWAQDKDRFERVVSTQSKFVSSGDSVALRTGIAIESSRVGTESGGTLNPLDVTGSLIPSFHDTFDIGQPSPNKRWRDAYLSRNLDMDGSLDVAGAATIGGALTAPSFSGTTFTASGTSSSDITCNHLRVIVGATIPNILTGVTFADGVSVTGHLVTTTLQAGGLSVSASAIISGALTVSGRVTAGGITVNAASQFGAVNIVLQGSTMEPSANNTVSLGRVIRRFANIFGSTLNVDSRQVFGGTMTHTGNAVLGNVGIQGFLTPPSNGVLGNFLATGNTYFLGSPGQLWGGIALAGPAMIGKGADIASGQTIAGGSGTYYDITGTANIQGITWVPYTAIDGGLFQQVENGTPILLQFDSTAPVTHSAAGLSLSGGITFYSQPGDHMLLIKDGTGAGFDNAWREVTRTVKANLGHLTYFSSHTDKTVGGTTVEGSIVGAGIGTTNLPANFFGVGRCLRLSALGVVGSTTSGANAFINLRFYIGTTVMISTGPVQLSSGMSNSNWEITTMITGRSLGTNGALKGSGIFHWVAAPATDASYGLSNSNTTTQIDTTQAIPIDLTAQWTTGGGDTLNTISCTNLTVEALG